MVHTLKIPLKSKKTVSVHYIEFLEHQLYCVENVEIVN